MASDISAKDEIKHRVDISELIGNYVELRKAGRNFVGRCPFHGDKDPSFNVNIERQSFHCFGCKKGGDIFSFWMEYHGTTFPEAIRDIAEKYGIPYTRSSYSDEDRKKAEARKEIFSINELAARYFEKNLSDQRKGGPAREYFKHRKITGGSVKTYRLGFAVDEWDGLLNYLRKAGVGPESAVRTGVAVRGKGEKTYDRFRNRAIFPLIDQRDQVVGFGGRVLDDSLPKYLNSPETPIFHKSRFLYGLPGAAPGIRSSGRIVVVEGYMDCIALQCRGLNEVVATLGTALTEWHVSKFKSYGSEVFLVFDADEAGKKAAAGSLPVFLNEGVSARIVTLEPGYDPDSYVNAFGMDAFVEKMEKAPGLFDFFIQHQSRGRDGTVEGNVRILKSVLPVLASLENDMQLALYIQRVSQQLGIKEEILWHELDGLRAKKSRPSQKTRGWISPGGGTIEKRFDDLHLLNLLVHHPETLEPLKACECLLLVADSTVRDVVKTMFHKHDRHGGCTYDMLHETLENEKSRQHLRDVYFQGSRFTDDEVALAVAEIERKVERRRMAAIIAGSGDDLDSLNKVIELKRVKDRSGATPS